MPKTKLFIEKARAKHGDRYDYSKTVYVRNKDKVLITCKIHGDFEQTPSNHLGGRGCAKCSGRYNYSTQEWIQEAIGVHGDRYSYEHVAYVRAHDKVIITCSKHGVFEQSPSHHLAGKGCAKCGKEAMAAKQSEESKNSFIERSRAVHGDRYGYERAVYVRALDKVFITCKKHGDFEQEPSSHLNGHGCPKCGLEELAAKLSEESKSSFIERSRAAHGDRYDYSKAVYTRCYDKVIITCAKHGDFEQTPKDHLNGAGCPSCPKRFDQPSNLYLMHNGLGKVKVGYAIDLNRRITELNRDAPFEAELLETWTLPDTPTVRKIEGKVHRRLARYHAGLSGFDGATEWFNTSPDTARKHILKALSGADVLGHSEANSLQLALI